ncbi:hypothetical protein AGABI1DRAFT_98714 [Agaricus bisporus var. burnettii JB137-S8]|uniref:HIT-type domain-containing protein n=1 Tax=Agaricus bisporus var. burnettii (strain JB137-S8 / ATCC MYA-4627 / FGSC 10392) TaxID=597362 RepID=K5WYG6_AGABU|nr:uncharacterized protein AGABI1DRAFT_98714 [Agaricus bisporus var. burnettii JB137-S8]EKM80551.1 hypothetical protein AGABI1DRAFT_98714 [Agaricus bisporus var. burnettii JB137-S8]
MKANTAQCQVCSTNPSKYTCSKCYIPYCSVACFKEHKHSSKTLEEDAPKLLRPLTSLNWPYIPESSAFPDPLKRNDPKDLQLRQYEAIATSSKIRSILSTHENLPDLLTSLDNLRGPEREEAIQKALQVTPRDIDRWNRSRELGEDTLALRELAEAVEAAIRGNSESSGLGLDWGD